MQDAFDNALCLEVKEDDRQEPRQICFVTPPALVALKIVALTDRPEDRAQKDGADIAFVIHNYVDAGNKDRLRHPPHDDVMNIVDGDLDQASALLIGRDMAQLLTGSARDTVLQLIRAEASSGGKRVLAQKLCRELCRGNFGRARRILGRMAEGFGP